MKKQKKMTTIHKVILFEDLQEEEKKIVNERVQRGWFKLIREGDLTETKKKLVCVEDDYLMFSISYKRGLDIRIVYVNRYFSGGKKHFVVFNKKTADKFKHLEEAT